MVEWHLSNIQSIVAIPYMEISNWRTKQSSDQSLKYSMSGDVSLEEATAPCFLTELHIALVFVQPVHYRCDQWASIWHFSWVSVYDGSLVEACYFRYACQKNFFACICIKLIGNSENDHCVIFYHFTLPWSMLDFNSPIAKHRKYFFISISPTQTVFFTFYCGTVPNSNYVSPTKQNISFG